MGAVIRWVVLLLACLAASPSFGTAPAPDYAREDRWASEIVPAIVVGDAVYLSTLERPKVLALLTRASDDEKGRVILVHGLGVHPDFGMIGTLRGLLAEAGYTTLSVQMPVLASDAPREDYPAIFDEAGARLQSAVAFLRARGPGMIAVVSHSMGAAMVDAWRAKPGAASIEAWVPIGMGVPFSAAPTRPVLDVLAEQELPVVVEFAPVRRSRLPRDACSRQLVVPGADHYFESRTRPLAEAIVEFLDRVRSGGC